jgi:hypothetical protein
MPSYSINALAVEEETCSKCNDLSCLCHLSTDLKKNIINNCKSNTNYDNCLQVIQHCKRNSIT